MTPQEELQQIYKDGIEIDLRENRSYTEECENFDIDYIVENRKIYILSVLDDDNKQPFENNEIVKLENLLNEFNDKSDKNFLDYREFKNINY